MKIVCYRSILFQCSILLFMLGVSSVVGAEEKKKIYIGVDQNRVPYAYVNSEQKVKGSLVSEIKTLCKIANAQCYFITGEVSKLLEDLRAFKLNAVLILDSFIIPAVDKIQLSQPLCKIKPIFVQKKSGTIKTKIEEFKGSVIGVQKGSFFHLYLLESYSRLAQLKPYSQLENGIFDLESGRINSLFADNAFFKERIANTSLGNEANPEQLMAIKIGEPDIPETSMTLAFRKNDKEVMTSFFLFKIKERHSSPDFPPCDSLSDMTSSSKR